MVGVVGTPVNGFTGPLADEAIGDVIIDDVVEFKVNGSVFDPGPPLLTPPPPPLPGSTALALP